MQRVAEREPHLTAEQIRDEIDLCLLDVRLPDGDGLSLLEELTPREPEQNTSWLLIALAIAVFVILVIAMLP